MDRDELLKLAGELRQQAAQQRSFAAYYNTLQQSEFPEMWRIARQNALGIAERLEYLAAQAEAGFWPPTGASLCVRCAHGEDPTEERCEKCAELDCCGPSPSWAEICEVCGEAFCPQCGRWIPNCQRDL